MKKVIPILMFLALAAKGFAQPAVWGGATVFLSQGDTISSTKLSAVRTYILSTGTWTGSVIGAQYGGTGQSTYTIGDIIQASASTTLSKLNSVATGNALISGGVATVSSWGKIGLTTHISGTLAVANGGTGATTVTGLLQGNGTSAFTAITNSTTVGQILRVTGSNTYGWGALDLADADAVTGVLPFANGGMDIVSGRATAQTAANNSVATLTVGGADASYSISGNILITTSSAEAFSLQVDYTDEGNTARTVTIPILRISTGAWIVTTLSASGAVPYPSTTLPIRCKASTAITVKTSGTFTGCTYNVEARIIRI